MDPGLGLLHWKRRIYALLAVLFVGTYIYGMGVQLQLFKCPQYHPPDATDQLRHWPFSVVKYTITETRDNHGDSKQVTYGFNNFSIKPGFTCPRELLTQLGQKSLDGHKWTCGLTTLGKRSLNSTCVIYSFGVGYDSYFEAEVLEKTECIIYAYDPTVNEIGSPLRDKTEPRLHFQKLGIGGENIGILRTLKTLVQQNGHEWVDIVKLDVESSEYASLNTAMKDFPNIFGNQSSGSPFGQLLVEVHVEEWRRRNYKLTGPVIREKAEMVVDFLQRLERWGLRMFNFQINAYGTHCSEFSFLNVNPQSLERFIGDIGDVPLHY